MKTIFVLCVFIIIILKPQFTTAPFFAVEGLYDTLQTESLGLSKAAGTETFTIFRSGKNSDKFVNGVVLFPFKGGLYAQWQSSALDEDAPGTWVAYSRSSDGHSWSKPGVLAAPWPHGIKTSGGWWSDGDTLVAYINVWPASRLPRGGYCEFITSTDGMNWSGAKPLTDNRGMPLWGIFEQDPHLQPSGRIINALHLQPGLITTPFYTDDPLATSNWTKAAITQLPFTGHVSRAIEPSTFRRRDGSLVMIFRDQQSSFRKLASVSTDNGLTWTQPVLTNMPDSRSKQSAGNLPDGTAYMVNNPSGNNTRIPLAITISRDGIRFNKAFLLRAGGKDLQALRFPGKAKRAGYHYPKSIIWQDHIYISYAVNKEDAEITRVPIASLIQ